MDELFAEIADRYYAFLDKEDNDQEFLVDNPYAGELKTTIPETIFHIANHGSYHRGNIAAMLRQQGYPSVMQDYGLYLFAKKG
jgi:uncharacterized damage-inducible protein DinB